MWESSMTRASPRDKPAPNWRHAIRPRGREERCSRTKSESNTERRYTSRGQLRLSKNKKTIHKIATHYSYFEQEIRIQKRQLYAKLYLNQIKQSNSTWHFFSFALSLLMVNNTFGRHKGDDVTTLFPLLMGHLGTLNRINACITLSY